MAVRHASTYRPSAGARFLTRDPLAALTREPYAYAGGNPINGTDPTGLGFWDGYCVRGVNCDDGTPSLLESWGADHPEAAQQVVNAAGGVLSVNPITAFLPLDLEGHGVDTCSGWYTTGQVSMLAVDLWAGAGTQAARMRDSALLGKGSTLFGRGSGVLNSNNILRLGWGWKGSATAGQDVFRIGIGQRRWHIEIWEVGRALFR